MKNNKDSKEKFTRFTMLMTPKQKHGLKMFCAKQSLGMSDFVRQAIRNEIERLTERE
ncbi:MAG: hypothetical protein ACE5GV_00425 [Candidatus Scalindua sp.]